MTAYKCYVNTDLLMWFLNESGDASKVQVLEHMCRNLEERNVWVGTTEEIASTTGLSQRTVRTKLGQLAEENTIVVVKKGAPKSPQYKVLVPPHYGWKGHPGLINELSLKWTLDFTSPKDFSPLKSYT